jgi:hypothetical protein
MVHQLHKVVYKPDSQSTDEYIVIVNKDEVRYFLHHECQIKLIISLPFSLRSGKQAVCRSSILSRSTYSQFSRQVILTRDLPILQDLNSI